MSRCWNRFWFAFRVSDLHLALFRVAFFGLFAFDAWIKVENTPRVGMLGFNVNHLAGTSLEALLPAPNRPLMVTLFVAQAYLAAAIAVGRLSRVWIAALAVLHGLAYFVSQLDSYQHHYMMFLVLCVLAFQRWQPEARARHGSVGNWPLRLLLVLVSVVYFWAIVTKIEPMWLAGRNLEAQGMEGWTRELLASLSVGADDPLGPYAFTSKMVIVIEAILAVAIHIRVLRLPAALLGMGFHLGLELAGFLAIGLFSYFMVAIYLLVLPVEDIRAWLAKRFPKLAPSEDAPVVGADRALAPGAGWIASGLLSMTLAGGLLGLRLYTEGRAANAPVILVSLGALLLGRGLWLARQQRLLESAPEAQHAPAWQLGVCILAVLAGSAALWLALPFEESFVLATIVAILGLGLTLGWWLSHSSALRIAATHLAACAAIVLFANVTEVTSNYYYYWGSAADLVGDQASAVHALSRLTEIAPNHEPGHTWLGRILLESDPARALQLFRRSQQIAPGEYGGYLGEAIIHHRAGRGRQAYDAAILAEARSPGNAMARRIIVHWKGQVRPEAN